MREWDDAELLSAYASQRSEEAFRMLVERYVALVYSAALRQVRDPHLAEEVSQAVFVILSQKAHELRNHAALSGWLCRTAYFAARNALKSEYRRQYREHMAAQIDHSTEAAWTQLSPLLDEAVAQLGDKDRTALVLRFYEQKPLVDVGRALGVDADAAQKRVGRALEKLRKIFTKRGLTLTTALIAGAVSANSIQAAPIGLATSLAVATAQGAVVSSSTLTLIKGALKVMAWTKAKTAVVVGAGILLAGGTTTLVVKEIQARTFYIGATGFPNGDSIEITAVRRTSSQLVVKGHYNLVSADNAQLALYVTTKKAVSVPTDSRQTMEISHGHGDFELIDPNMEFAPGWPHVTMYSTNGGIAGVYFGTKQEAAEELRNDPGGYRKQAAAPSGDASGPNQ